LKVTVIGLGKLGLPLAVQFASKNNLVVGLDIDFDRVNNINLGQTPIAEELDLDRKLKEVLSSGHLKATTDPKKAIADAEIIVVTVPLITNAGGEPDFSIIDSVTESIGNFIKKGTLVCYETTVPIGTTRNRFGKRIYELSNLEIGHEIFIVFSPERVLTGRVFSDLRKYPKIVGGLTENCTLKGLKFYQSALDFDEREDLKTDNGVWNLENTEAAEFVKLAETTYRDVNIGLANLFAKHAQELGLNIKEIIDASNSQLYSHIHEPGISVGGHCIPVYPYLYLLGNNDAKIVSESRKLNESMPEFFVKILLNAAGSLRNKKILVLGATYRPGVKEVAYSGVFRLKELLIEHGALPFFSDPLLTEVELNTMELPPGSLDDEIDFVILHTGHESYNLSNFSKIKNLKFVIDGRNFFGKGYGLIDYKS
jgi:nucleotide sugar dehydrogenase